jgi:hypothetical protein
MLSWSHGTPFALCSGTGPKNGKILHYINKEEEDPVEFEDPIEALDQMGFFRKLKKTPKKTFEQIREVLVKEGESVPPDLRELYTEAHKAIRAKNGRAVYLNADEKFALLPDISGKREEVFIAAPTGAGKTAFACHYLLFCQLLLKKKVIIFTANPSDATIDAYQKQGLEPLIINIHEKDEETGKYALLEREMNPKDFQDCAVFFDDIEYLPDKPLINCMVKLRDDLMGVGRHFNITVVVTAHQITNYHKTRFILTEAKYVVFFPHGGLRRGLEYFLQSYVFLKKEEIQEVCRLPTRWVAIHTREPRFLLFETGSYMLNLE